MTKNKDFYELKYRCECLIDQDLFVEECGEKIGLGHTCWNNADYEMDGMCICAECCDMMLHERHRITLPPIKLGINGQRKMIERIVSDWKKEG
jgi:hypothetical protein